MIPVHTGGARQKLAELAATKPRRRDVRRANEAIGVFDELCQRSAGLEWALRGWILDDFEQPVDEKGLAELLGYSPRVFTQLFTLLRDMNWIQERVFRRKRRHVGDRRQPPGVVNPPQTAALDEERKREVDLEKNKEARAGIPSLSRFGMGKPPDLEAMRPEVFAQVLGCHLLRRPPREAPPVQHAQYNADRTCIEGIAAKSPPENRWMLVKIAERLSHQSGILNLMAAFQAAVKQEFPGLIPLRESR